MGYDVSNYEKVWPTYGTNEDCFELIDKTQKLGIKSITDLIMGHCSTEHEWFEESRSSKTNPKRDWFFWRPPKGYDENGKPITRFSDDSPKYCTVSGKLFELLECQLTGTLYIYQGQELGQINLKNWPIEKHEDVDVKTNYNIIEQKFGENSKEMKDFLEGIALVSRDHSRTPMPWSKDEPNAGFTGPDVKPWFYLNESFQQGINVEQESKDDGSVLNFWRRALEARRKYNELMVYGYDFQFIDLDSDQIFSFTKEYEDKTLFAALNFSGEEVEFNLPREGASLSFILGNYDDVDASSRVLKPWEGRIYLVK